MARRKIGGSSRLLRWIAIGLIAPLGVVYVADDLSLQLRFPHHREQFGSVEVQRLDAIPQKDGKTEFVRDDPETQVCVYALFPHFGDPPCWYAARHTKKQVNY